MYTEGARTAKDNIGLIFLIAAIIVALMISARAAIFDGAPLGGTQFYPMLAICGVALVVYFVVLKGERKKK